VKGAKNMKLLGTMEVRDNELYIGGVASTELVKNYGTPLYVIDEKLVRNTCKSYYDAFKVKEGKNRVAYAGKAFLPMEMCRIINEEGLCLDVVSGGELFTAYKAGFPLEKVFFHGNNKSHEEIKLGINLGVGTFVVDNLYEIELIDKYAKEKNVVQNIYFRITPGIEAHTHDYIQTGQIDSKFGFTIDSEALDFAIKTAKEKENIKLIGIHAHIGSQIFDIEPYGDLVRLMFTLAKRIRDEFDIDITDVDLGGGIGVYYTDEDEPKSAQQFCETIVNKAEEIAKELRMEVPRLVIEPGRSVIGNAGSTLYTIGAIKSVLDIRKYVSIDGGMTDNIRPALYNAAYECALANRMNDEEKEVVTVAGKCCESGDILLKDVEINKVNSGDILVVPTTGAYGYSMSNNYNKTPKAAVVSVMDGNTKVMCRRQSYEELIQLEN